jgi:uncharacterized protein (TIGR03083 family)
MSRQGLASAARSVAEVKQVITTLSETEAALPSGCTGWSVKDLVAHMSSNFKEVCEPSPAPAEPVNLPAETLMELLVEPRKDWTWAQVRDEYLAYCDPAVAALGALQDEPMASTTTAMADLGTYPLHQMADAFAFDHYCHLRVDLLAPSGPIHRDLPAADDALVAPAVGWMLIGLPQMQPGLDRALSAPITLELTGPGGGRWRLAAVDGSITVGTDDGPVVATVTSSAHDFVLWGTCRRAWRELCTVTGDANVAATFLDALNIV